ncbi:glycosyltransferase family 4 protein [Chloroflexota bacterium]
MNTPPLGGGAANACYYLIKEMAKKDVFVDLVTSSPSREFQTEKIGESIDIYKLPVAKKDIHYWTQREILTYSWKARKFIKGLMKEKQYDLCHAFFGIPCGAIAYLFRKELPYIVSLRGSDVPGFNQRFSFQYIFLKPVIRKVWKNSGAVIANSEGLKELAKKTDRNCAIDIIYNGIDTEQFKPTRSNGDKLRILCVSRLIERKGIDYLLRSLPLIKERYGNVFELWIVGEGNLEQHLKGLSKQLGVEDIVSFKGYVEHDRLPETYSSSDIFVLPSLNEGMSNTILEAMASGLPIVTTDTGGTNELIKGNGIVIASEDIASIADAIGKLIEDPTTRIKMGDVSLELAQGLSWAMVTEQYIQTYNKVALVAD